MFDFFRDSSEKETPPESSSALSIIGQGSTMKGSLELEEDDLRVDGTLDGDVQTKGHVHVAKEGTVQGDIRASSIRIAGKAEGVLYARESLVLLASSVVHGILCGEALTIEDGADFEGGISSSADRIPALKSIFSSTESYTMSNAPSSRDKPASSPSPSSSEPTDQPVPSSENGEVDSLREEDPIQAADASSASPETDETGIETGVHEESGTEEHAELEW